MLLQKRGRECLRNLYCGGRNAGGVVQNGGARSFRPGRARVRVAEAMVKRVEKKNVRPWPSNNCANDARARTGQGAVQREMSTIAGAT